MVPATQQTDVDETLLAGVARQHATWCPRYTGVE
jgi:hypothetical protein